MTASKKRTPASGQGLLELKNRILFVVFGLVIYRLGTHIPVPGLNPEKLIDLFNSHSNTILGMFNMFSGGALSRLSVFAIGIMPYISASIIIQLFTVVSPKFEQLKKEGESGRRKINQYTRFGTLVLAIVQSAGMTKWLVGNGIALSPDPVFYFTSVATLVTGTMFLMWLGEQITEKGVGNGISLIIFAGIVSKLPSAIAEVSQQVSEGQMQPLSVVLIGIIILAVTAFVVFIERGQRRIKINYAQRTQGRKVFAAQSSHLPLKINMAGVIPPIFASSIILLPATFSGFVSQSKSMAWLAGVSEYLRPETKTYALILALTIMFFAFFYTALVFNPKETADNLKKSGALVPGIRPGEQTAKFIDGVMTRLTLVGALYLVFVCLIPQVIMNTWHVSFYFGGTSLLIIVVVIMDFISQVQSHVMSHQYESLLKKSNAKGSGSTLPGML